MNNTDYSLLLLNSLIELAAENPDSDFSITKDQSYSGYYVVSVGKHSYLLDRFTQHSLINAVTSIKAGFLKDSLDK